MHMSVKLCVQRGTIGTTVTQREGVDAMTPADLDNAFAEAGRCLTPEVERFCIEKASDLRPIVPPEHLRVALVVCALS